MKYPLYDHEIDAVSFLKEAQAPQRRWSLKPLAGWIKSQNSKAKTEGTPAPSSDWIARLNLLQVMGVGILLGSILSLPIIFVFQPSSLPLVAFLFFLFLLVPVLKSVNSHIKGKLLTAQTVAAIGQKLAVVPRTQRWADIGVIVTFTGGIGVIVLVGSIATSHGRRQNASQNAVAVSPMPPNRAASNRVNLRPVRSPVIASSRGTMAVPPLVEEPEAPVTAVSEAELRELRDRCRREPIAALGPIMDGVRRTCDSNAWQRRGWRDYQLEFALDELIYRIKRATEQSRLELPVRFGEVPAGIAESPDQKLAAMRTRRLQSKSGCFLLVDGDIELSYAERCVILATGKVTLREGVENVIIAGDAIDVGTENAQSSATRSRLDLQGTSLWISGTTIKMYFGRRLICAAPDGIDAHCIRQSTLVNSPIRQFSENAGCTEYTSGQIDFRVAGSKGPREPRNPS
jgi:hypothetical protein